VTLPAPRFTHLRRLTDAGGLFEHALGAVPRREHGYCVDDVARALVVASRELGARDLEEQYLAFVLAAQVGDGRFRNRRAADLSWQDIPPAAVPVEDCWGRALWGLGTVVGQGSHRSGPALAAFEAAAGWRTEHRRAMAFAAFGAAEVVRVRPGHRTGLALLRAAAERIGRPASGAGWPWPEPRLSYANAALPDALIAAGTALDDPSFVAEGLWLLEWLLDVQIVHGRLSVVPVGGWGPAQVGGGPGFDQQPIEVAALADACARAFALTGEDRWAAGLRLAVSWFLGANDARALLYDPISGGGCDGLHMRGRNENRGAESTLAALSTLQHARALLGGRRAAAAGAAGRGAR
jgi:hypothetical protein